MNRTMKYVGILSILLLCVMVTTIASAAIQQQNMTAMQYPSMGYGYTYSGYSTGGCGMNPQGIMPYPYPTDYCMHWQQPQLMPVQVMIPGRWEYRPVWVPGYPTTLYYPVPGYWQRTGSNGQPDVMVWPNTNGGWYATPYQSQAVGGFNPYGLWQGTVPTQSQTIKEK